jgi:transcriptional regulator of heat shock response
MEALERYFIRLKPEEVLSKLIEEREEEVYHKLSLAERIIREELGSKANEFNLRLLLGNSVKSIKERIEFLEILKKRGMEEKDLNIVKELLEEAAFLM